MSVISSARLADCHSSRCFQFGALHRSEIEQGIHAFLAKADVEQCLYYRLVCCRDIEIMTEAAFLHPVIPKQGMQILNNCGVAVFSDGISR
jgi:hypothetical protein